MIIWKIRGEQTFDQTQSGRLFSGMDISADYIGDDGKPVSISFHYSYHTNDLRGRIESVLSYLKSGKPMPEGYSSVVTKRA